MIKNNIVKIEKAVYFSNVAFLNKIKIKNNLSRIYFGDEFCPFHLPKKDELELVLDYVKKHKLQFTFVTSWLTDEVFEKVEKLIKILPENSEVVINDYSLLSLDRNKYKFVPILGRLLNGQIRGLRLDYEKRTSKNILEHSRGSQPQTGLLADFYKERGINRIELDNLPQGIKTNFKNMDFHGSLYYPYGYITVTRFCPYVVIKNRFGIIFSIKRCNKACQQFGLTIENKEVDKKIFVKGNAHFFKNIIIPKNLLELGIDRLVEELF
ncbi:MAG: hypothetical protein PHX78_02275 [bacterium]|nr:hypothetical protein [bacterium]